MIIGKKFKIDAAHFLPAHKGKCKEMHGHTWTITIELQGQPNSATGMVMDFGELQKLYDFMFGKLDHSILNKVLPTPTCEYLAQWIFDNLYASIPNEIYAVKVQEGDGGYAYQKRHI